MTHDSPTILPFFKQDFDFLRRTSRKKRDAQVLLSGNILDDDYAPVRDCVCLLVVIEQVKKLQQRARVFTSDFSHEKNAHSSLDVNPRDRGFYNFTWRIIMSSGFLQLYVM